MCQFFLYFWLQSFNRYVHILVVVMVAVIGTTSKNTDPDKPYHFDSKGPYMNRLNSARSYPSVQNYPGFRYLFTRIVKPCIGRLSKPTGYPINGQDFKKSNYTAYSGETENSAFSHQFLYWIGTTYQSFLSDPKSLRITLYCESGIMIQTVLCFNCDVDFFRSLVISNRFALFSFDKTSKDLKHSFKFWISVGAGQGKVDSWQVGQGRAGQMGSAYIKRESMHPSIPRTA